MSDREIEEMNLSHVQANCPRCNLPTAAVRPARARPVVFQVVEAIRDADWTAQELQEIRDALTGLDAGTSPREAADSVPAATGIITAASRKGHDWLPLLIAILSLLAMSYFGELAHQDAHDATVATNEAAKVERSSELTPENIAQIVAQLEVGMRLEDRHTEPHSAHPKPEDKPQ